RVAHFPPLARHSKGIASTGVDGHRSVEFERLAVLVDGSHSGNDAVFLDHLPHHGLVQYFSPLGARVVEEHLVELTAQDLPGAGSFMFQVREKIKGLRGPPIAAYELDAVFLGEMRALQPLDEPHALEWKVSIGEQ